MGNCRFSYYEGGRLGDRLEQPDPAAAEEGQQLRDGEDEVQAPAIDWRKSMAYYIFLFFLKKKVEAIPPLNSLYALI